MPVRLEIFLGVIFATIILVKSESACPNEPVTPLPTPKSSTECPNLPVTPLPTTKPSTECPNMPVTPVPTEASTEQTTSSSTVAPQIAAITQRVNATLPPTNETNNCLNRLDYIASRSQCCQLCCQDVCSSTNEITRPTPPTLTTTTSSAAPEALIKCPSGTVLLGRRCHLLYCPSGSQMINDRCIVTECPEGTVWTGHRCSLAEPIVHNLKFQSTILTQLNQTNPQIVLNNTNNIFINASLSLQFDSEYKNDCKDENSGDCNQTSKELPSASDSNCCDIMTPRICKQYNNRWRCYSRRSRRCGEFCIAPTIYLRPSRIHATETSLVMPPMQNDCHSYGNCDPQMEYDCSGCEFSDMKRCSNYCYRYMCPPRSCDYYDQEKYCALNVGFYGCQEEDGCFDSWCL